MYWRGVMAGQIGHGIMEEDVWRKGPWTSEEDRLLIEYVRLHGEGRWNCVARLTGLKRNGKSCRLRWVNYLRPDLKRGQITPQEENIILELHARWGNRWSTIARSLPGRTDNEIKNYWRTHFKKKAKNPSDAAEKAKNRILRKQLFHQQQQQLNYHQQQQQLQFNMDMKGLMSLFEENNNNSNNHRQEMFMCPNTTEEQQGNFMVNGNYCVPDSSSDDNLWDGLWNLDEVHGNFSNKTGLYNLVAPYC
ncbi:unnamed protein product [Lathyrus sativus]|nr:unnamed protein product [Lathyrus sativus]